MKKTLSVILSLLLALSCLSAFSLGSYAGSVEGVSIINNSFSLGIGESHTLSAEVYGEDVSQSVIWSLTGNKSEATVIDSEGTLTLGIDETANEVFVTATSVDDSNAYAELRIKVFQYAAEVTDVKISNPPEGVKKLSSYTFKKTVSGTQLDISCTFTLSGNKSEKTVINQSNGKLYIAKDETAETLTIRATSNYDPSKYDEVSFAVLPYTEVTSFTAEVDYQKILLSADHTEGEVKKMLEQNVIINFDGAKSQAIDLYYMYSVIHGIGDGSEQVSTEREYYLCLYSELAEGFVWPDSIASGTQDTPVSELEGFKVAVNGKEIDDALITFNSYWNGVKVYVPMGKAAKNDDWFKPINFPDVKEGAWYYEAAQYCAKKGYISGYQNGNFGPNDNLKRQDFVVILSKIAGADLDKYTTMTPKLKDVKKGAYYAAAVNWAVDNNIIAGYANGNFGVNDNITREQVATILYRYMGEPEIKEIDSTLAKFKDVNRISGFAKTAVAWAVRNNVISGMADGRVAPTEGAARAQIASIIMRMDQQGMFNKA